MVFVENDSKDAAFHFSVEEYFTRYAQSDVPVLMLWQTGKTVMIGNNQVVTAEIDLNYAKENEIKIVRRSSGGGAIYTDSGTFLYTVIEPVTGEIINQREEVAAVIIDALGKMGITARREGRNDILVEGKKISGLAQYTIDNHVCTHGSLLYDADLNILTKVLIPNETKLTPKGITSIRSRVTNIKPYTKEKYTTAEFYSILKSHLFSNKEIINYNLSDGELAKIKHIYKKKYGNSEWNFRM